MDLEFIKNIKFDPSGRYLLGFGGTKIFIFDYANNKGEIVTLNTKHLEKINDASILVEDGKLRCLIASKKLNYR